MTLPVYFNATPLLLPKTGIRQYAHCLLTQIERLPEIVPRYFYLARWSDDLSGDSPTQGASHLWKLKNVLRDHFPLSLEIQHRLRERMFRRGLGKAGAGVYHELNFLPFDTALPTVVTVHDLSVLRFPQTHPAARVRFIEQRLARAVGDAAYVIADSEYVRREIIAEYGVSESRVVAVPLAASAGFRPQPKDKIDGVLACYAVERAGYFLAVGTLEPRKNLVSAIRAYAALPDSLRKVQRLVLAGLRGWENDELDSLLQPLVRRGEARVLGFVPDDDLPALYAGATGFIYPSLYEGFGLPPLEAMACGTPVITSNRSSLPEVVGDAGIMVDALDIDGLRDAMLRLIFVPEERDRLSELGIERCELFSWERTAAETVAVYKLAMQACG